MLKTYIAVVCWQAFGKISDKLSVEELSFIVDKYQIALKAYG